MRNLRRPLLCLALLCLALAGLAAMSLPAMAGELTKSYEFKLDEWFELKATDGPATLHRFRVEQAGSGGVNKFTRAGSSDYSTSLEIQIEYTNDATNDWKAQVVVEWLDAQGNVIDGYRGSENMDEGDRHELMKHTVTTLKYGVERAKKLRLEVRYDPD